MTDLEALVVAASASSQYNRRLRALVRVTGMWLATRTVMPWGTA
jgi:hypothetical protein